MRDEMRDDIPERDEANPKQSMRRNNEDSFNLDEQSLFLKNLR